MSKKYYVEVQGLDGDTGEEQLIDAGISRDSIMVIDQDNPVETAVRQVTGMGLNRIRVKSHSHKAVNARMLYVYYSYIGGDSINKISKDIGLPQYTIRRYLADIEARDYGDKQFARDKTMVQQQLIANPSWHPTQDRPTRRVSSKKPKKKPRTIKLKKKDNNNNGQLTLW